MRRFVSSLDILFQLIYLKVNNLRKFHICDVGDVVFLIHYIGTWYCKKRYLQFNNIHSKVGLM